MKVFVDQDRCVASGQCVFAAEGVFDQRDDDGIAVVLDGNPPDDRLDDVREAEAGCPASAILVEG
ncbi:ferredoxin [Kribbella amoyensis]|uniref:Ferredoxin n=1 Tax=Kribbella amoyensis TaxID=996641 RepID=A0A561BMP5_9ACTN|nr:ferredoxin [Kribbella amoyensis]TWD80107.1 ferredoxin [Kribbella amoyensis]